MDENIDDEEEECERVTFKLGTTVAEETMNSSERISHTVSNKSYGLSKNETSFFREFFLPSRKKITRRSSSAPVLHSDDEAVVTTATLNAAVKPSFLKKNSTEAKLITPNRNSTIRDLVLDGGNNSSSGGDLSSSRVQVQVNKDQDQSSEESGNSVTGHRPNQQQIHKQKSTPLMNIKNKPPPLSNEPVGSSTKSKYKTRIKKLFS